LFFRSILDPAVICFCFRWNKSPLLFLGDKQDGTQQQLLYKQIERGDRYRVNLTGQILSLFFKIYQFEYHKFQNYWRFIWLLTLKP